MLIICEYRIEKPTLAQARQSDESLRASPTKRYLHEVQGVLSIITARERTVLAMPPLFGGIEGGPGASVAAATTSAPASTTPEATSTTTTSSTTAPETTSTASSETATGATTTTGSASPDSTNGVLDTGKAVADTCHQQGSAACKNVIMQNPWSIAVICQSLPLHCDDLELTLRRASRRVIAANLDLVFLHQEI